LPLAQLLEAPLEFLLLLGAKIGVIRRMGRRTLGWQRDEDAEGQRLDSLVGGSLRPLNVGKTTRSTRRFTGTLASSALAGSQ
jgi:hypothetical protein